MDSSDRTTFLDNLINIRTWTAGTNQTPHKYLLLLSMLKILETYPNHGNAFTFSELQPVFRDQAKAYGWYHQTRLLEYPFFYMSSDGFWYLKIKKGQEDKFRYYKLAPKRLTKSRLLETVEYAYLDQKIYDIFCHKNSRDTLKERFEQYLQQSRTR